MKIEILKNEDLTAVDFARIPGEEELWEKSNCPNQKTINLLYLQAGKEKNVAFEVRFDLNKLLASKQSFNEG